MARLPRRGDPRRPLVLATRACLLLGILGLLVGTVTVAPLFVASPGGRAQTIAAAAAGLTVYGGTGAAYLAFAYYLRRRKVWAVVAALSLTGVAFLMTAGGAAAMAVVVWSGAFRSPGGSASFTGILWGSIAFEGLVAAAMGQLVYWLARSFAAVRSPPAIDADRGFDVLPVVAGPTDPPQPEGTRAAIDPR